jgi:hypothetical protein
MRTFTTALLIAAASASALEAGTCSADTANDQEFTAFDSKID